MPEGGTYSGPGVVDNMFDPAQAGIGTHTLTYTYMDEQGCENSADQTVIVDACTGIPEHGLVVTARPNPTSGSFELNLAGKSQTFSYKVLDVTGKILVQQQEVALNGKYTATIDLSDYSNGIYFILVQSDGTNYFRKVILNK